MPLLRRALTAATLIGGFIIGGAALTTLLVERRELRPALHHDPPFAQAVDYLTTNATTALLIIAAAAVAMAATPGGRGHLAVTSITDPAIAVGLALPFLRVGEALGAYHLNALAWLPHLPIEAGAIALAAGAYLEARTSRQLEAHSLIAVAAIVVVLLALAAGIEAYLTPIPGLA